MHVYLFLGIISVVWCILHSLLISLPVTNYFRTKLGTRYRFYRLVYNLFSFLTFLPVIYVEQMNKTELLFSWKGPFLQVIRGLLFLFSATVLYLGAKEYDGREFLGLRQLRSGGTNRTLHADGSLHTSGVLSFVRHPWYLGSIIIIWLRSIYLSVLIVNIIFSLYLIVGSMLEEYKLKREFGETYRTYQKEVSMLIPWKWVLRVLGC